MATTTVTGGNLISPTMARGRNIVSNAPIDMRRARKISAETAKGIEMLGHAIEYLSDDFAYHCLDRILGTEPGLHPRLRAIELLKALNRQLYLSCPEVPTFSERMQGWFRKSKG